MNRDYVDHQSGALTTRPRRQQSRRGSSFHCLDPEWNARKTNKLKLLLKDLGEKVVDAEISRRIQKGHFRKKSRAVIEQMGYFIQQTVADISRTPDEFVPKRKRCYMCPHSKDKKAGKCAINARGMSLENILFQPKSVSHVLIATNETNLCLPSNFAL